MNIHLTNTEVEEAISRYIRANCAVSVEEVHLKADRKNGGATADVIVTVNSAPLPPESFVKPAPTVDVTPVEQMTFGAEPEEIQEAQLELPLEPNEEEFVNEEFQKTVVTEEKEETHQEEVTEPVLDDPDDVPFDIDTEAERMESVIGEPDPVMNIDFDDEEEETPPPPAPDSSLMNIADMLSN